MSDLRIGLGIDAHAFADAVPLVLGGVRIDHPRGLAGHSDGDVIAHALTDALLGAAGLGDIGTLFPSDDERWRGADSLELLRIAYAQVRHGAVSLSDIKRQIERDCIARALAETKGNITRAAALLGMKRPRLSQLVKQYGLSAAASEGNQ